MALPADSNSNDPFFLIAKHEYTKGVLKSSTGNLIRADTLQQFMQQELRKTEILWNDCRQVSPPCSTYQPNLSPAVPWQHRHTRGVAGPLVTLPSCSITPPATVRALNQPSCTGPGSCLLTPAKAHRSFWQPQGFSCDSRSDGLKEGSKGQKRLPIYRRRNLCEKWLNTCTDRCGGVQGSGFPHSINSIF